MNIYKRLDARQAADSHKLREVGFTDIHLRFDIAQRFVRLKKKYGV